MWVEQIRALSTDELVDLNIYFYGEENVLTRDRRILVPKIRHAKKRYIFYMMDKDAYKCLRKVYREPMRFLNRKIYHPQQAVAMGFVDEIIPDPNTHYRNYEINKEALPVVEKLYRARHYDPLIKEFHRFDEIMFGLIHTYGMLELNQCVELLKAYGFDADPRRLAACLRWRYALKDVMQIFDVTDKDKEISYIIMKDLHYPNCLEAYKARGNQNLFVDEKKLRQRADRYFAMQQIEFEELMKKLLTTLSRNFTISTLKRLIDCYQYDLCDFPHQYMLERVFGEDEIGPYLTLAKESLIHVYDTNVEALK